MKNLTLKLTAAAAIGAIVAILAHCPAKAAEADTRNLDKASLYLSIEVMCERGAGFWKQFAHQGIADTGWSAYRAKDYLDAQSGKIVDHVVDNGKQIEFCLRGVRDLVEAGY